MASMHIREPVRHFVRVAAILILFWMLVPVLVPQSACAQAINQQTNGGTDDDAATINKTVGDLTVAPAPPGTSGVFLKATGGGGDGGSDGALGIGSTSGDTGGGGGNVGGGVYFTSTGAVTIQTSGADTYGISVISQGGGGGGGGNAYLAGDAGNGGGGGVGRAASVTNSGTGSISTNGSNAHGIYALSVGGRGGTGGDVSVSAGGGGGTGGDGGSPGDVTVNNRLDVTTDGVGSAGIWAQTVGGRGGDGGDAQICIWCAGGRGASAGVGGSVDVVNNSAIRTFQDNSFGIFAQSVGGYSGNGGGSFGLLSFAGDSSSGGNGGTVRVQTDGGSIHTSGVASTAIFAQSGGGGGGAGGAGGGLIGFGGDGGKAGTGLGVTVVNHAALTVDGNLSSGIFAQSFGGGGGTAGVGGGLAGIGGKGGGGGDGGAVWVENYATINVGGSGSLNPNSGAAIDAAGIYAQSIGGGGGNGGLGAGLVGIGGSGGTAGAGGAVTVINNGDIIHSACGNCTEAPTIFAQSVGGGGGDGGSSGGLVAVGGHGSGGGNGGAVTVTNKASLTAYGDYSAGLFAQSVGGGGGNGGSSYGIGVFASVAVGGTGGAGGNGGQVCVNANGGCNGVDGGLNANSNIQTHGYRSAGIFAQSVGGGGGSGGAAISASVAIFGGASVGVGGDGSNGGYAQDVFVGSAGTIGTAGAFSAGIFAESVGGGGGSGGYAIAASVGPAYGSLGFSLGGSGGAGNRAGNVTVVSDTNITTNGVFSAGIQASAVGGGGGDGGFSVAAAGGGAGLALGIGGGAGGGANGGGVDVTSVGNITTGTQAGGGLASANSAGIFAQSVGGSGGTGGFAIAMSGGLYGSVSVGIGGEGGNGGDGLGVTVHNNDPGSTGNKILTWGDLSDGIFAQSVGGSGGNGGFSVAAGGATYGSVDLSFGGKGNGGGTGGVVDVTSYGAIETHGARSNGILAQSVGGGGGNGGFAAAAGGAVYGAVTLAMGGSGAQGGDGNTVTVHNYGAITTSGLQSNGIFAQSVGGGGGNGGLALSLGGSQYASLALSFGGTGANGGAGKKVSVDSTAEIRTGADQANGILAQSIGGAGGNGGAAISGTLTIDSGGSLSMAIGGKAGGGATSGDVHVGTTADVTTGGMGSNGILAQSIGGSGGNGGLSGAISVSAAGGSAFTGSTGGNGGTGNFAGNVDVSTNNNITTTGSSNANGIYAQSVGGGGGNGGFSLLLAASYDGTSGPTPKTVGGNGGTGGAGGTVGVQSLGTVQTTGALSDGIFAQSVGGGGGRGGFSIGASLSYGGATDVNGVGGNGGSGNTAAQVSVIAAATAASSIANTSVKTQGDGSVGILAQSIGGGGGQGGFSIVTSFNAGGASNANSVGGSGNAGGDSLNDCQAKVNCKFGDAGYVAAVQVTNTGNIQTSGRNASGIQAQSIGGGGGDGGFSIGVSGTVSDSKSKLQTVGGSGGAAGAGADVVVQNNAFANSANTITTAQDLSYGILAQSVGGGGGNGGFAIAGSLSTGGGAEANATGGQGSGGGSAGRVTVTSGGGIITGTPVIAGGVVVGATGGQGSIGILAQSIGGGGGSGGFAGGLALGLGGDAATNATGGNGSIGGDGGIVTVNTLAGSYIVTFGDNATGILAQSVGGGGGNGGFSIGASFNNSQGKSASNTIGGQGGAGGAGMAVTVNNQAVIQTFGLMSDGIIAQSIGGGGGNGGFAVGGTVSLGGDATNNTVGGSGAGGGNAGTVDVTNSGVIQVARAGTIGILAQSVGGGGGNGGFSGGVAFTNSGDAKNTVGGTGTVAGGPAGDAAKVTVTNSGAITADGDKGIGILAQSVGGGGGNGGFAITAGGSTSAKSEADSVGGSGGAGGKGGAVVVTNNSGGALTTNGAMAYGIIAQSVGGGGGNGGFSTAANFSLGGDASSKVGGGAGGGGGSASTVNVDNYDVIHTKGVQSTGILAQSVGGGGGSGGFAGALTFATDGKVNNQVGGGSGGTGSSADSVTVVNHTGAVILTDLNNSVGILAQAIGGGGGSGGFTLSGGATLSDDGVSQTVGGSGAGGGSSAFNAANQAVVVSVQNDGVVAVNGQNSIGILAQSIGGGGGNGGFTVSGVFSNGGATSNSVGGAAGGGGGDSGAVNVTNSGIVSAGGDKGIGILAQSIGGGGGNGGFVIAGGGSTSAKSETDSVGGSGGSGGAGGAVAVINNTGGMVSTDGAMAYGIVAQSVGGGGGNGGFSTAANFSLGGDATSKIGGGAGGGGGAASTVNVDNYDVVHTKGMQSTGILAQSIGGGGGSGGFVGGLTFASGGKVDNQVGGGNGGTGNSADSVTVVNHAGAVIQTDLNNSVGILAQAIGGGGGSGGFTLSGAATTSGDGLSQTVGGNGAGGGSAAFNAANQAILVSVQNDGIVTTKGQNSIGILAQSIGGGGGNAGVTVAGTYSSSGGSSTTVGATAGLGGDAGAVKVVNTGTIYVQGANSVGIYAQSVGGGGGNAAFTGDLNFTDSSKNQETKVGAQNGAAGGNGGNVTIISTGSIITTGANSIPVFAQSVGGGGGNNALYISAQSGSVSTSSIDIGSFLTSAPSGSKGTVTVELSGGTVSSSGDLAYGVLAQAVGAGGGNGAVVVPDPLTVGAGGLTIGLGSLGSVGDGSLLTATNANAITTTGVGAAGYIGQSIGGGGGMGSASGDLTFTAPGPLTLTLGGSAGGGSGGHAIITNTATSIVTGNGPDIASGDGAVALLGQSIGGGGGGSIGAFGVVTGTAGPVALTLGGAETSVNNGGELTLASGNTITTYGRFAPGVVGQTIGGGGGYASVTAAAGISAADVEFQLGSTGGTGGAADPSQLSTVAIGAGTITTNGKISDGLVAQAIGGGGGLAGFVSDGAQLPALGPVVLGALAGGGAGATIGVTNSSTIVTSGSGSIGAIAQSIGGGGGTAQAYGVSAGVSPITLGATGGTGGAAGAVSFETTKSITTSGVNAHGIVAQSIGGGGGLFQAFDNAGNALALTVAGSAAANGNGGAVDVKVDAGADIRTTGNGAHGIVAQSVGGGGGLVGGGAFANTLGQTGSFAGSAGGAGGAGTVMVNVQSNIVVSGLGSTAIYAQSVNGAGTGGDIGITLGNAVLGTNQLVLGSGNGAVTTNAVTLSGGANNTLTSYALLSTMAGIDGTTIRGGTGNDAVTSFGHMIGSIDLGGGTNSVDNKPYNSNPTLMAGVFDAGPVINLGGPAAGNVLTNEGLLSPGALFNVLTTNLNGNFVQTAAGACGGFGLPTSTCGYFGVDLDLKTSTADRLNATGTANVSGAAVINIGNAGDATPGTNTLTLISAAGGETHPNLAVQAQQTAVAQYSLVYPNATDIDLKYSIDFSPGGLTLNQHSVGNAINAIQTAHVQTFRPIAAALFYQPSTDVLGAVYDTLSGEGVAAVEQTAISANDLFHSSILGQARFWMSDNERNDPNSLTLYDGGRMSYAAAPGNGFPNYAARSPGPRTWRIWTTLNGGDWRYPGNTTIGTAATSSSGGGFASGLDYQFDPTLLAGIAVGYGKALVSISGRETDNTVEGTHIAGYAAKRFGNAYVTGSLGLDYFTNTENRFAAIPGTVLPPLFGTSIPPIQGFAEHLRGAFSSYSVSGMFEGGYKYRFGNYNVTPLAGLNFTSYWMNGFTENNDGAPSFIGLSFANRNINSVPTFIGAQIDTTQLLPNGGSLFGWARATWVHEFLPHRTVNPSFIAAPGFDFVIDGALAPTDLARISLGAKVALDRNVSVSADVRADLYRTPSIAGFIGVKVSW